jgi:hypothetical protein
MCYIVEIRHRLAFATSDQEKDASEQCDLPCRDVVCVAKQTRGVAAFFSCSPELPGA